MVFVHEEEEEGYAPAVVVVAVDVQDLLALDTQHTVGQLDCLLALHCSWLLTQKAHIQSDLHGHG